MLAALLLNRTYFQKFINIDSTNDIFFYYLQDSENNEPEGSAAPQGKKNEKALLARIWGNFDSK